MSPPDEGDSEPFPRSCRCGARYTRHDWDGLPGRGTQPAGAGHHLELRVCTRCGSTLSIELPDAN